MTYVAAFITSLAYFLIYLWFNFYYTAFPVHAMRRLSWSERARVAKRATGGS